MSNIKTYLKCEGVALPKTFTVTEPTVMLFNFIVLLNSQRKKRLILEHQMKDFWAFGSPLSQQGDVPALCRPPGPITI